ncbi:MAG: hypothetical protein JHC87_05045 [Thermoleophilaceae bacterium]|nr:hypothetical protein [Thermoleophilaceae bacterium]
MRTVEVSRTLVKSPPEVWAEIERVERLCELLGDDAIRVTASKPEQLIEWEGSGQRGTIAIKSSGWGTKVSLTAEVDEVAAVEVEVEVEQTVVAPQVKTPDKPEAIVQPEPAEPEPTSEVVQEVAQLEEKVAKQGLWTRIKLLFTPPDDRPRSDLGEEEVAPRSDLGAEQPAPTAEESAIPEPEDVPRSDLGAEDVAEAPRSDLGIGAPVEAVVVADVAEEAEPEVSLEDRLTAVLDHLGSAHKRPFTDM